MRTLGTVKSRSRYYVNHTITLTDDGTIACSCEHYTFRSNTLDRCYHIQNWLALHGWPDTEKAAPVVTVEIFRALEALSSLLDERDRFGMNDSSPAWDYARECLDKALAINLSGFQSVYKDLRDLAERLQTSEYGGREDYNIECW